MTEEAGSEDAPGAGEAGGAAWAALAAAGRAKADRFLDEQAAFIRLQSEHLREQRQLNLSHLKWRRFDDQLKGALQIILVALGALAVIAIGAVMWNASQADGFVMDEFSAPPAFAQAGITGDVLADDVSEKLDAIRRFANENSYSHSKGVSADRKDDVRVEIPDTGISISQAWQALRNWLGNERHITGGLRDLGGGDVQLTMVVSGMDPVSVSGPAHDLSRLEDEASERVFGQIDPVNIVNYFSAKRRIPESYVAAAHFAAIAQTPLERADSFGLWSYTTAAATGDIHLAIERARIGISIDPKLAVLHIQLAKFFDYLGWDEDTLQTLRAVEPLRDADQMPAHRGLGFALMHERSAGRVARLTGDYANAESWNCAHLCSHPEQMLARATTLADLHEPTNARRALADATASGDVDGTNEAETQFAIDAASDDWRSAELDARRGAEEYRRLFTGVNPRLTQMALATRFVPLLAVAEAHLGDFVAAHRVIDTTPGDCYACARARARIDLLQNRPDAAAYWFGRAISRTPSIPFAYAERGAMFLRNGKYDLAIADFARANSRGPHFADPLELWGEALMQKNRSDLALKKFEEADRYAPGWGRLHFKWGEACLYTGKPDEAKKQFAIASRLDLDAADRSKAMGFLR